MAKTKANYEAEGARAFAMRKSKGELSPHKTSETAMTWQQKAWRIGYENAASKAKSAEAHAAQPKVLGIDHGRGFLASMVPSILERADKLPPAQGAHVTHMAKQLLTETNTFRAMRLQLKCLVHINKNTRVPLCASI